MTVLGQLMRPICWGEAVTSSWRVVHMMLLLSLTASLCMEASVMCIDMHHETYATCQHVTQVSHVNVHAVTVTVTAYVQEHGGDHCSWQQASS